MCLVPQVGSDLTVKDTYTMDYSLLDRYEAAREKELSPSAMGNAVCCLLSAVYCLLSAMGRGCAEIHTGPDTQRIHTRTHTHSLTHTPTHIYTHTTTHIHTHTHTYTHTQACHGRSRDCQMQAICSP
jgi:carbohydrate-binding DOMON domain-containing protein